MSIEVHTTQNVIIDYEPAGLGNRMLAALVDFVVYLLWVISWVILFNVFIPESFSSFIDNLGYASIILLLIVVVGPITFYHLLFEYYNHGQSIGKMFIKIRVVKVDGTRPSLGSLILRWLFRPIDIDLSGVVGIPGLVGLVSIISSKKSQRVGDMLAGTTVIDLKVDKKSKKLRDIDLDFADNYQVIYVDVLNRLSDKDVQTIISIIDDNSLKDVNTIIGKLSDRIKHITGYTYDGADVLFLRKIVSDYNYLSIQ